MSTITIDEATAAKLRAFSDRVELLDANGNLVGIFRPIPKVYQEGEVPELSPEEIQRRLASPDKLTSDEVMRRLRARL
jgi:hypothetical protein